MVAKKLIRCVMFMAAAAGLSAAPAHADTQVSDYGIQTQGHSSPSCRMVELQTPSGALWFRIQEVANNDDGILAGNPDGLVHRQTGHH